MVLSFDQSGSAIDFGLAEVRELAVAHGFVRALPGGASQPDLDALFAKYGCKALSTFKKRFCTEKLPLPNAGMSVCAPQTPDKCTKVRSQ
jgi:hypothetical protein